MAREQYPGQCEGCGAAFQWYLIHNGFNSSCHAYCSQCGETAILSLYAPVLTSHNAFPGGITPALEPLLASCSCGGRFLAAAGPRCPSCARELSAVEASKYIEPPMPGTPKGWRWQRSWTGDRALYAIVIGNRWLEDPFIPR
jgi:hypothetical protein